MATTSITQIVETLFKRLPRDIGNATLARARDTCPIQTGELFRSLYVNINTDGFELGATVPYASDVEEGTPAINVSGKYVSKIKSHKRKTKNGTTTVKGHTKTFEGNKPTLVNPTTNEWRTIGSSPGKKGTFFMHNAVKDSLAEQLEKTLRSLGGT